MFYFIMSASAKRLDILLLMHAYRRVFYTCEFYMYRFWLIKPTNEIKWRESNETDFWWNLVLQS